MHMHAECTSDQQRAAVKGSGHPPKELHYTCSPLDGATWWKHITSTQPMGNSSPNWTYCYTEGALL